MSEGSRDEGDIFDDVDSFASDRMPTNLPAAPILNDTNKLHPAPKLAEAGTKTTVVVMSHLVVK